MTYNPKLTKLEAYSGTAYIDSHAVTPDILHRLAVNPSTQDRLKIEFDFRVDWDDDIPLVIIDSATVYNNDVWEEESGMDFFELEQLIESKGDNTKWQLDYRQRGADDFDDYIEEGD